MESERLIPLLKVAALLALTVGCRTLPPPAERVTSLLDRAHRQLPVRWDAIQTVIFEIKPHWWWPTVRMTILGYAAADSSTGDYRLVCLSPLGMKMFEISRIGGRESVSIPTPELFDKADFLNSVRRDASRLVGLDLPRQFRVAHWDSSRLTIEDTSAPLTRTRYVLSISNATLLEKSYYEGGHCLADVAYSDYHTVDGVMVPYRVVLRNREHDYRLSLAVKEFHPQR